MATATIVTAYQDGTNAYITARVAEGGSRGNVEYSAQVPLTSLTGTNAEKKAVLVAALKAVRDQTLAPAITDLSAVASGNVTI
jgi:hypothetical protein